MHVSRYPHNLSLGEVEYRILRKLLSGVELTDEEEARADQMSHTLEQNEQNTREPRHRHRVPSRVVDEGPHLSEEQEHVSEEQEAADEQFSPS
jgi:hypothetical protein